MPTLQFKGKAAVENHHRLVPHHRLEFDRKLSKLPKGEAASLAGNLIVEGDNLLALKALLPTHAGRVKCIYIDPPYNTGNEGWVYNDNLTQPQFKEWIGKTVGKEGEDACRDDKWCCMMYPRLQLLRDLLTDDGVIFVSIDDIELEHLLGLMDDIFGRAQRIGVIVWRARNYSDSRPLNGLSADHEYVVAYGRTSGVRLLGKRRDMGKYSNPDGDKRGDWTSCSLRGKATKRQRPNLHYVLVNPDTNEKTPPDPRTGWIYSPVTMDRKIAERRILWPSKRGGVPREKVFARELRSGTLGFPSVIDGIFTADGTEEVEAILGPDAWAFPKPSMLIQELIEQVAGEGDIVLDSFAGSGSTAHAVLALNRAESSGRSFVLVQQRAETQAQIENGTNLCETITAVRVTAAIEGYKSRARRTKGERIEGLGGSFTYARLGAPLFGEYRDFGEPHPSWDELASYVFYTETSRQFEPKNVDRASGRIGSVGSTSYYLLYDPDPKVERAFDMEWLKRVRASDDAREFVVYCEKVWIHREDLVAYERDQRISVRPMVVPFQMK